MLAAYGDPSAEYRALNNGPAVVDRSYRSLLEVTGRDRATWLHNLTTNQVKPLQSGEGNYAFCLNVQGRILFDLNILVRPESIWLDLDRVFLAAARKHFDKYTITEDVKVADRADEFARFALVGEGAKAMLCKLGAAHAATLPTLGTAEIALMGLLLPAVRTDFCGPFAVEVLAPANRATQFWEDMVRAHEVTPVGDEAVQVRRIEAGLPWPGREITDESLPAETGQLRRAVSFQKGCYLGQEIVERMRSRGVVARSLRGLLLDCEPAPPGASVLEESSKTIGIVTSACHSLVLRRPIAMAYLKSAVAPGQQVSVAREGGAASATVVELPFTGPASD